MSATSTLIINAIVEQGRGFVADFQVPMTFIFLTAIGISLMAAVILIFTKPFRK